MTKASKEPKKNIRDLPRYEDWLIDSLKNKKEAGAYLQAALEEYQTDGNTEALLLAFRHVAMARGGIAELAKKAELSRETLYRTLSKKGNPKLQTLGKILRGLGFSFKIKYA